MIHKFQFRRNIAVSFPFFTTRSFRAKRLLYIYIRILLDRIFGRFSKGYTFVRGNIEQGSRE